MYEAVYHKLARELEKYFREGTFPEYLPSVRDLCKQFQVSKNTVSKALHELAKRNVITIVPQRGIKLNPQESSAPRIRFNSIGIAGICGLPQQEILYMLNRKYRKYGFSLLGLQIYNCTAYNRDWLLQLPVDGLILLNSASHPRVLDWFYTHNIPVIGCPIPGYEHLVRLEPDHYAAYKNICQKLLALGHKRIAFVRFAPNPAFDFYVERIRKAMQDTLQEFFDPDLFVLLNASDQKKFFGRGTESVCQQVMQKFQSLSAPPTVIIAEQGFLHMLRFFLEKQNIMVPDDISMYAIQYPTSRDPFFASAMLREDHSVEIAVRKMITMLKGKNVEPEEILIPMSFFPGRSVKDLT